MEEALDNALIADKPESLVDEEACDSPRGHNPVLRCASIVRFRLVFRPSRGAADPDQEGRTHAPAEKLGQCREYVLRSQACPKSLCRCHLTYDAACRRGSFLPRASRRGWGLPRR